MTAPDVPLDRPRLSRRAALTAGLYGAGAIALGGLAVGAAVAGDGRAAAGAPAAAGDGAGGHRDRVVRLQRGLAVRRRVTAGAERPGYDDRRFADVTVPHTVVPLSWTDWNYRSWQQRWIYRKHFDGACRPAAAIASCSPSTG